MGRIPARQGPAYWRFYVFFSRIQFDTDRAELERDCIVLSQKEELFRKKRIPLVEGEIARLKDDWSRQQLVVHCGRNDRVEYPGGTLLQAAPDRTYSRPNR